MASLLPLTMPKSSLNIRKYQKLKGGCLFCTPLSRLGTRLEWKYKYLFHQYFPKKMDFQKIDKKGIEYWMDCLNSRPKKSIDFAAQIEVFF